MRPTFLGFDTARKSIMASQKALDITGQNIANVNTKGYTRQRLDLFSVVTPSGGTRYSNSKIGLAGQGVIAAGVSQIRDPFLDKRFRDLNADTANSGIQTGILTDVENILDNIDSDGIQKALTNFRDALSTFATSSADSIELASIFSQKATQLVNVINSYDTKLTQLQEQTLFEIDANIGDLNAIANKIAVLNKAIVESYVGSGEVSLSVMGDYTVNSTYGPNELLDTRNTLLDALSTYGDIDVKTLSDGSVTVEFAGTTLVKGSKCTELTYKEESTTGALILSFTDGNDFQPKSGSLKGYVDLYNGNGCYSYDSQTGIEGIPYYKTVIDKFAQTLASAFNAMNVDTSDPTTPKPMFQATSGSVITAANLRSSNEWLNNPSFIIPTTQEGGLDNGHLYNLLSVFDKSVDFGEHGDFTGTFDQYISYFTNKLGQEISFQSGKYDSSLSLTSSIMDSRDSVSAVSVEEEGINMMNFQKWFNASARLMTTLDEALNTIINNMGLVGR